MFNRKYTMRVAAGACAAALLFTGCSGKIDDAATLVTINGGEDTITLGYGNFVTRYTQATYDQYYSEYYGDTNYWKSKTSEESEETMLDSVKEDIMYDMKTQYVSRTHAKDYDVEISDQDEKKIKKAAKQFMDSNSEEAIANMGATEDYLIRMLEDQTYTTMLEEAVRQEGKKQIKDEDVVQTSFTYVHFSKDSDGDADNGEAESRTEEELLAAAQKVAASDDFDTTAKEEAKEVYDDCFTKSYSVKEAVDETGDPKEVIQALKKMKEGEVSDVIEVKDDGWYVVRLNHIEDEQETETEREDQMDIYYEDKIDEWKNDTEWDLDEKQWAKVQVDAMYAVSADSEESADEEAADSEDASADETTEETEAVESDAEE